MRTVVEIFRWYQNFINEIMVTFDIAITYVITTDKKRCHNASKHFSDTLENWVYVRTSFASFKTWLIKPDPFNNSS